MFVVCVCCLLLGLISTVVCCARGTAQIIISSLPTDKEDARVILNDFFGKKAMFFLRKMGAENSKVGQSRPIFEK